MGSSQLREAADVRRFALAGRAHLTLRSKKTGTRFTYRLSRITDSDAAFASVLTGSNNEGDYSYAGIVDTSGFRTTRRSALTCDAPSVRALEWFSQKVLRDGMSPADLGLEVYHEGRCGKCARLLTTPESVERGIGPECWSKMEGRR
jgi:hypothetical protein